MERTKKCKLCKVDIPYNAKVCPRCAKKQGGNGKWIILAVVLFFLFAALVSGENDDKETETSEDSQIVIQENNAANKNLYAEIISE